MNEIIIQINANQLRTKNQFKKVMAENCQFPNYFGDNLAAVNDCMRDLTWFNENKIIIEFKNLNQLKTKNFAIFEYVINAIDLWQSYWQQQTQKTVIFLSD